MKFFTFGLDMNASIEKMCFEIRFTLLCCDVFVLYNCNNDANGNEIS